MSEIREGEAATFIGVSFFLLACILLAFLKVAFVGETTHPAIRVVCGVISLGVGIPLIFSTQARNYIVRLWAAIFIVVFILALVGIAGIILYGFFTAK